MIIMHFSLQREHLESNQKLATPPDVVYPHKLLAYQTQTMPLLMSDRPS